MTLIICTECGKEFSDRAVACPNCGCPAKEMVTKKVKSFDEVFSASKTLVALCSNSIRAAKSSLLPSENVFYASILNISTEANNKKLDTRGSLKGKTSGVFVITDKRVLFINSSMGVGIRKEIAIKDITSIDSERSLFNCPTRIKGISDMIIIDGNKEIQSNILSALSEARN